MTMPYSATNGLTTESPATSPLVHGEDAHNKFYSDDAFARMRGDNKEYHVVPGAVHVDLYDDVDVIPWDVIEEFLGRHLA